MSSHDEHKRPRHQLKEIFCQELPSRSCPSHISSGKPDVKSPSTIRLATERHCVNLSKRDGRDGDEYAITTKSLPCSQKKRQLKQTKLKTENTKVKDDESCACISHSFLAFDPIVDDTLSLDAIEVFAIARESQAAPTNNTKPSHAKTKSETSICGVSITESVKEDAGSMAHDDSKSVSFELHVRCRAKDDSGGGTKTTRHKSMNETISLNFRPSVVHTTELNISATNAEPSIPAIGIFLTSSTDNKLRLYVATKQSLHEKCDGKHNPVKSPCFNLTTLSFETINEDKVDSIIIESSSDPFVFCSSITALDTLAVGRLAVALFDGTIHIISYHLKHTGFIESIACQMNRSTFIIDGPVASLHFGELNLDQICAQTNQEPLSNVFLVAGSLCGFACLFYEESQSNYSLENNAHPGFGGPLALVDELYDPIHGNEDCVTAVHAYCSNDSKPMIAIGTQRGRILLLERTMDSKYAFDVSSFLRKATSEQNDVACMVTGIKADIDACESEKYALYAETERLQTSVTVLHAELENLDSYLLPTDILEDDASFCDEDDNETEMYIGDVQIEPYLLQSKVQSLEVDVTNARERISIIENKILELQTSLANMQSKLSDSKTNTLTKLYSSVRKMHRYELVCQYQIPYPIHAIHFDDGKLLAFTRRTVHAFQKILSDSVLHEDKLMLFEQNLAKLLDVKGT